MNEDANHPERGATLGSGQRYADLSEEALRAEARALGLSPGEGVRRSGLAEALEARVALIDSFDRAALLDLAAWAEVEDAEQRSNRLLVRDVLAHPLNRLDELPLGALRILLRLRNIEAPAGASHEELKKRLRRAEGFWPAVRRRRRKLMGSLLSRVLESEAPSSADEPAEPGPSPPRVKLKRRIQDRGVVSGIATTLRGAADDYIEEKLDEIEERIDHKLEQIDQRLAQWRDREVANRLRILKITLIFSILVALVSLGYDYLSTRGSGAASPPSAHRVLDE